MTTLVDGLGFEELGDTGTSGDTGSKVAGLWITGSVTTQSNVQAAGTISGAGTIVGDVISGVTTIVTPAFSGTNIYSSDAISGLDARFGDSLATVGSIVAIKGFSGLSLAVKNTVIAVDISGTTSVYGGTIEGETEISGLEFYSQQAISGGAEGIRTEGDLFAAGIVSGLDFFGNNVYANTQVSGNLVIAADISGTNIYAETEVASNAISGEQIYSTECISGLDMYMEDSATFVGSVVAWEGFSGLSLDAQLTISGVDMYLEDSITTVGSIVAWEGVSGLLVDAQLEVTGSALVDRQGPVISTAMASGTALGYDTDAGEYGQITQVGVATMSAGSECWVIFPKRFGGSYVLLTGLQNIVGVTDVGSEIATISGNLFVGSCLLVGQAGTLVPWIAVGPGSHY